MTSKEILHESTRIKEEATKQMLALLEPFADCSFATIWVDNLAVKALTRKDGVLMITYKEKYEDETYTDPASTLSLNGIRVLAYELAKKMENGYLNKK